jgi:hypothetical protein
MDFEVYITSLNKALHDVVTDADTAFPVSRHLVMTVTFQYFLPHILSKILKESHIHIFIFKKPFTCFGHYWISSEGKVTVQRKHFT